jgi:hypothetical protein
MFRALASDNFPPFGKLNLQFPVVESKPADLAEVHLFTGVNGTGKTRLLTVLAAMLGGTEALARRLKGPGTTTFRVSEKIPTPGHPNPSWLAFDANPHGIHWQMLTPFAQWCQTVPAFAYHGTAYVKDEKIAAMGGTPNPQRPTCLAFSRPADYSKTLLQAIANLTVQAGMESRRSDATKGRSIQIVQALEDAISGITQQRFAFFVTGYQEPKLLVRWGSSELFFDVLPDGLRAIIGWMVDATVMLDAWLQGKGDLRETEAVFLLDEPESHLHPVWQRRVLPAFQRLFPKAQIFVATHSPFVISSLNHGWIHRLSLEHDGQVAVAEPAPASLGDSYIYVLEEIMGLPEWYDPETEELLARFRALRDDAFHGNDDARAKAFELGQSLAGRSDELRFMMGKELSQMERRLGKAEAK